MPLYCIISDDLPLIFIAVFTTANTAGCTACWNGTSSRASRFEIGMLDTTLFNVWVSLSSSNNRIDQHTHYWNNLYEYAFIVQLISSSNLSWFGLFSEIFMKKFGMKHIIALICCCFVALVPYSPLTILTISGPCPIPQT